MPSLLDRDSALMRSDLVGRLSKAFRSRVVFVTAQVALLAQGCSYGSLPPRTLDGQFFRWDRVKLIEDGMADSEVRALLGEPFEIVDVDSDSVRWRYFERTRPKGDVVKLIGFIPVFTPDVRAMEVHIVLRNNVVENVRVRQWEGEEAPP